MPQHPTWHQEGQLHSSDLSSEQSQLPGLGAQLYCWLIVGPLPGMTPPICSVKGLSCCSLRPCPWLRGAWAGGALWACGPGAAGCRRDMKTVGGRVQAALCGLCQEASSQGPALSSRCCQHHSRSLDQAQKRQIPMAPGWVALLFPGETLSTFPTHRGGLGSMVPGPGLPGFSGTTDSQLWQPFSSS